MPYLIRFWRLFAEIGPTAAIRSLQFRVPGSFSVFSNQYMQVDRNLAYIPV